MGRIYGDTLPSSFRMRHLFAPPTFDPNPDSPKDLKAFSSAPVLRECRVFFRDRASVEHAVYVKAANRYHAFGLALNQIRGCSWSNQEDSIDKMAVELMNTCWRKFVVSRKQFEAWIGTPEDALRKGIN